jgi:hypothetical protein
VTAPKLNVPAAVAAPKKNDAAPAPKKNVPAATAATAVADSGAKYDKDASSAASLMYRNCIKTPAEFVRVFKSADVGARSRCVSPDLVGFLSTGANEAEANPANRDLAIFWFWSGHDGLEKYLRMGYPKAVGDWTVDPDDARFAGLQDFSNGQSLLTQIGFPGEAADVATTYSLNVVSASALKRVMETQRFTKPFPFRASTGPVSPTWTEVVAAYNEALGQCCQVRVPPAVAPVLDASTFRDLSGCPTQCTYKAIGFPSDAVASPVVTAPRVDRDCPPPGDVAHAGPLINPNFFAADSDMCSELWKPHFEAFAAIYADGCTPDAIVTASKLLGKELKEALSVEDQAVIFRAFVLQGCDGDLNPVNAGNGFTATGFGGLFTPTSSEFITSPFAWASLPDVSRDNVFFCINGKDGGQPVDGTCTA